MLSVCITDGDSVSIRECLSMGVPVIASDSVQRPDGCVLFRNRDMKSLEETVKKVLQDLSGYREKIKDNTGGDSSRFIIEAYKRVLDKKV